MLGAMTTAREERIASYERRYRDLARQLSEIGWIASGSIALRASRCGKSYCACRADPPRLHGPYWHFTAKVDGKTVNKRLTEDDARLYEEWVANDRRVRSLLAEMRSLATKAQTLMLADEAGKRSRPGSRSASPENRRAPARRSG